MEPKAEPDDLEKKKQLAMLAPHPLLVIDQLLKVKATPEQVQLTLGFMAPGETISATVTLVMPASFAAQLAKALRGAAK